MTAPATTKAESSTVARHIARVAARLFAEAGLSTRRRSGRSWKRRASPSRRSTTTFGSKEGPGPGLCCRFRFPTWSTSCGNSSPRWTNPIRCLEQVIEAQFAFCREDPDRARFIYALLFGPLGSEVAGELEPCKADLCDWTEAAVRRLAEVGIVGRDRVSMPAATACRGLIVISTLDFLYRDKPLTTTWHGSTWTTCCGVLANRTSNQWPGIIMMIVWRMVICWTVLACAGVAGRESRVAAARRGAGGAARVRPRPSRCRSRSSPWNAERSSGPSTSSARSRGWEQVTVGSKRTGRVVKVHHDMGDRVQPGEPLVELDSVDAKLGVEQAESKYLGELVKLGITKRQAEEFVQTVRHQRGIV